MLRPLRRTKSKNTLKIDEYKVRIHKPSEENRHPPLAAKAIAVPIARPLEESTCRQDPNRLFLIYLGSRFTPKTTRALAAAVV